MKKVDSLLPGPVGLSSTVWSHCLTWESSAWHLVDVWMFLLESQIWDIGRQYNAGPLC